MLKARKLSSVILIILLLVVISLMRSNSFVAATNEWDGRSYIVFDANYDYSKVGRRSFPDYIVKYAVNRADELLIARLTDPRYDNIQSGVFIHYNDEVDLTNWTNYDLQGVFNDKIYKYDYIFFIGHGQPFIIAETKYSTIPFYDNPTYYMSFNAADQGEDIAYPHGEIDSPNYKSTIYTPKWYFMIACDFLLNNTQINIKAAAIKLFLNKADPNSPITIDDIKKMYLHGIVGFRDKFHIAYLDNFLEHFIGELAVYYDGHVVDTNPIVKSWFDAAANWTPSTPAALYPIVTITAYKPSNGIPPMSIGSSGYYITIQINYGNEGMYPFMSLYQTPKEIMNLLENQGYHIIQAQIQFVYIYGGG